MKNEPQIKAPKVAPDIRNNKPQINADERRFIDLASAFISFHQLFGSNVFMSSIKPHAATRPKGGVVY